MIFFFISCQEQKLEFFSSKMLLEADSPPPEIPIMKDFAIHILEDMISCSILDNLIERKNEYYLAVMKY